MSLVNKQYSHLAFQHFSDPEFMKEWIHQFDNTNEDEEQVFYTFTGDCTNFSEEMDVAFVQKFFYAKYTAMDLKSAKAKENDMDIEDVGEPLVLPPNDNE